MDTRRDMTDRQQKLDSLSRSVRIWRHQRDDGRVYEFNEWVRNTFTEQDKVAPYLKGALGRPNVLQVHAVCLSEANFPKRNASMS